MRNRHFHGLSAEMEASKAYMAEEEQNYQRRWVSSDKSHGTKISRAVF
jgi:hypothetical protein